MQGVSLIILLDAKITHMALRIVNLVLIVAVIAVMAGCDSSKDIEVDPTDIIQNAPPPGRSISFSNPVREQAFKNKLTDAGIKYETITALEKEWVVWEFKDTEAVIGMWEFYPEQIKMFRELKSELENESIPSSH